MHVRCGYCSFLMALNKFRPSSFPPPETRTYSAVTWNSKNYHKVPLGERGGPKSPKVDGKSGRAYSRQYDKPHRNLPPGGAPPPTGSACCAKAGFLQLAEKGRRRHIVLGLTQEWWAQEKGIAPSVPRRASTRQKASCAQCFSFFNTVYLYSRECSSHAVPSQVRKTTLPPQRAQRRHVFLKAFSVLALFCILKTIRSLKGMLDFFEEKDITRAYSEKKKTPKIVLQ